MTTFVVVGASLAGGRAVETLRQEGFDGRIVLIGAEPNRPYERPPLSKQILRGEWPPERAYLRPSGYYDEQSIELKAGARAIRLDLAGKMVALDSGEMVRFDRVLIATGAKVRPIRCDGSDLPGIYYLRTMEDAERIRDVISGGGRVVVVGAGFIGSEVAASARVKGCDVAVLEMLSLPLQRALGDEIGRAFADIHRDHGVDLRLNTGVVGFRGHNRVEEVITTSGASIPCDAVVVGVGVSPDTALAENTEISVDNGILVDEFCRASVPDVFAAGDVANWPHPGLGQRIRVEHYESAQNQGVAAAKSMLGKGEPYAPVLSFWSDQYDFTFQYVGHASPSDQMIVRGNVNQRQFTAFYLRDGHLRAALGIGRQRDISASKRIIRNQVAVTAEQLGDESIDLRQIGK